MSQHSDINEVRYLLGHPHMDDSHGQFVNLLSELIEASEHQFIPLFRRLLVHTAAHFEFEDELMRQSGFPGLQEHRAEHHRVLQGMRQFLEQASAGSDGLEMAYVSEELPAWFEGHTNSMDSALADYIKENVL